MVEKWLWIWWVVEVLRLNCFWGDWIRFFNVEVSIFGVFGFIRILVLFFWISFGIVEMWVDR